MVLLYRELHLHRLHIVATFGAIVVIEQVPPAMVTFRTDNIEVATAFYTKLLDPPGDILTFRTLKSAYFRSFFLL